MIKILERWVKLNTTYKDETGTAWLDRLTKLKKDWNDQVGEQSGKKSEVKRIEVGTGNSLGSPGLVLL